MKNITRTIRTLHVRYPVQTDTGFETYDADIVDAGDAETRREIKSICAGKGC